MPKKETLFFITLLILGILDWLTTITGVLFFGATEQNPLMANFTQSNLVIFSVLKLAVITSVALCFFKATKISQGNMNWGATTGALNISYLMTATVLATVVSNNLLALIA